jgi:hypothetical protein
LKATLYLLLTILIAFMVSCTEDADPLPSVTHPDGWMNKYAENFHGTKDQTIGSQTCSSCHGSDYNGGTSGVSCYDCHSNYPHPPAWATPGSNESHAAYLKSKYWSLDGCQVCHGRDYKGGTSDVSCYTCHPQKGGPQACNTCHGTAAAPASEIANWTPPKDLDDNIYPESPGVGAHQAHMLKNTWTTAYNKDCSQCHTNVNYYDDPTHVNQEVDMEFSPLANWWGKNSSSYSFANYTCSNVYCHGNFTLRRDESSNSWVYTDSVMTGSNSTLKWTEVGTGQVACGTCHDLPPKGHQNRPDCSSCHATVVDENRNIINKDKHINGFIDVY